MNAKWNALPLKLSPRCYVNSFGYNANYVVGSKPIGSVTYKPQDFAPDTNKPLYTIII